MKILFIIIGVFMTASTHSDGNKWAQFKLDYGKSYKNQLEETTRFRIFQENLRKIEANNDEYLKGEVTYKLGVTKFADISHEEFVINPKSERKDTNKTKTFTSTPTLGIPDRIDWREKNAIPPVRDQGLQCDVSYSFAAIGLIESHIYLQTNEMEMFSAQCLIDCSQGFNGGCAGGGVENSLDWISQHGIPRESDYPYVGTLGICKSFTVAAGQEIGYVFLKNSESALAEAVAQYPVGVMITGDNLHLYTEGIISDETCGSSRTSQSGLLVGYDTTSDGQQHWMIQFSWGTDWGEGGYARIARNAGNMCGIADRAVIPIFTLNS